MALRDFSASASYPIEVVGGDGRRRTVTCAATARDGRGKRVMFDPDGNAYQQDAHGSLRHHRAPEFDLGDDEPKPSGDPRPGNMKPDRDGFLVHVFDTGTGERIGEARVQSDGRDPETGLLRYRDSDGTVYIAARSGKGVNPV